MALNPNEEAQLMQTIEMFEVITQSQPLDYQSLEILKEAYFKLDRHKDVINTSKRIAEAYVQIGQLSSAILEYESVLQLFPDDPDVKQALAQIENRASSFSEATSSTEADTNGKPAVAQAKRTTALPTAATANQAPMAPADLDDGRKAMHKIFVAGKLLGEEDFNHNWHIPAWNESPPQVIPPFIQVVAEQGILSLDRSVRLLCEKTRLGFLPIERYELDIELTRTFPPNACRRWCVLPFDRMSKSVLVATANPFNKQAMHDLETATRHRILWYMASPPDLMKVIQKVFR